MLNQEGKDKWKYEKIYNKKGILKKQSKDFLYEGTFQDFQKNNIENKWLKYGHSNEGKNHIDRVLSLKPKSLVDIGCGGNQFCKSLKKRKRYFFSKKKFIGVDIASPYADIIAPAHNIPSINDKEFDLLTSFDCIEHIPDEEIEASFLEFSRISERVFLQICLENSPTQIDGHDLHVSIHPKEWWIDLARKYFEIQSAEVEGKAKFDKLKNYVVYKDNSSVRELLIIGKSK